MSALVAGTYETIGSLIRTVTETLEGEFDATTVAEKVLEQISPDRYADYLLSLIASRVSSEVGQARRSVTPARKSLSTKQALIRDQYWPAFLNQHIALPSGYKRLAEATVEDLVFLAEHRRAQASELVMRAEQFEALASLMQKQGAKFLEELDSNTGEKLLAA